MPAAAADRINTQLRVPEVLHEQVQLVAGKCNRSLNATYVELVRGAIAGQCQADVAAALEELFPVG
jgi:hypothetical protein